MGGRDLKCGGNQVFPKTGVGKWYMKWSEVKWSEVKWSEVKVREFEAGWRTAKYGEGKRIKEGWDLKSI